MNKIAIRRFLFKYLRCQLQTTKIAKDDSFYGLNDIG